MLAIETKTIEKYVKEGVSPKLVAKEHEIDVDTVNWLFEGIKQGTLSSKNQEFVLFS